ncbi:MAG: glycerol-3-phosphate dehydrogenase/oxidase, partial [Proteobacteria bacterium]|nr:glycerol-3-phosphate dehydrogenase/oxidase [Pseudomonadota bacterium]
EAASERAILHRIAPHLAQPSWFILPSRSLGETAKLKAALVAFDQLGGVARADRHRLASPAELARIEPLMRRENLHRGLIYREYLTDDARLTVANLRSARAHGAVVANYLAVRGIGTGAGGAELRCEPTLPGEEGACLIRARLVINAAGPWVDALRAAEDAAAPPRLALSRGIHLVFERASLPVNHTVIINTPDRRSVFAVPRGGFTYLGTTDGFYPRAETWPAIERAEADYLLGAARAALDAPALGVDQVIAAWAGLRPLVQQAGKAANEISRADEVWTGPGGMISIAGGKLSAYRAMAQRIVDLAMERLGLPPQPCPTADEALPGGESAASLPAGLEPETAERLARLYGSETAELLTDGGDVAAEARRAVQVEGAVRLEDWWVRRSSRAWFDHGAGRAGLAPAAAAMGALLGWDTARQAAEVAQCEALDRASRAGLNEDREGG